MKCNLNDVANKGHVTLSICAGSHVLVVMQEVGRLFYHEGMNINTYTCACIC